MRLRVSHQFFWWQIFCAIEVSPEKKTQHFFFILNESDMTGWKFSLKKCIHLYIFIDLYLKFWKHWFSRKAYFYVFLLSRTMHLWKYMSLALDSQLFLARKPLEFSTKETSVKGEGEWLWWREGGRNGGGGRIISEGDRKMMGRGE